ncbi:hypothetical protein L2D08_12755 [Domibacillus sp. PGB-M46]|uniref:hypothetical protein n=1 Tax=Domibacillus sp. PGB-M46 TaxID=2910255 RepID=UPI001F579092|nr:hypothetical protein [Domibacillus sp. PGB-M46]MCI2255237.1 hypothetical protein [Domibacillus sp. PGB-M46]
MQQASPKSSGPPPPKQTPVFLLSAYTEENKYLKYTKAQNKSYQAFARLLHLDYGLQSNQNGTSFYLKSQEALPTKEE